VVTYNTKHFMAVGEQVGISILTPAQFLEEMSKR